MLLPKTDAHSRTNGKPEKRDEQFSLRLGHTRVLTSHRDVIHYARAASLPVPYKRTPTAKHPPAVILSVGVKRPHEARRATDAKHGRISRRSMFAQTRVLFWRLCTGNSSFAKGLLSVTVRRSLRRKRLDFLLLTSFDCKKLRGLRTLRMTDRSIVL